MSKERVPRPDHLELERMKRIGSLRVQASEAAVKTILDAGRDEILAQVEWHVNMAEGPDDLVGRLARMSKQYSA